MHPMILTFSEMALGAAEAPGIQSGDISRCATLLRDAADDESDDHLSILFLQFVFSPTLTRHPILDDRIKDAAQYFVRQIGQMLVQQEVPGSSTLAARHTLLLAIAAEADMDAATRNAIKALKVEKMTSHLAGPYSDVNPLELPTPRGIVLMDRMVDLDASPKAGDPRVCYRVGLRPYFAGGEALGINAMRYATLEAAKAALLMFLDDSVPAQAH